MSKYLKLPSSVYILLNDLIYDYIKDNNISVSQNKKLSTFNVYDPNTKKSTSLGGFIYKKSPSVNRNRINNLLYYTSIKDIWYYDYTISNMQPNILFHERFNHMIKPKNTHTTFIVLKDSLGAEIDPEYLRFDSDICEIIKKENLDIRILFNGKKPAGAVSVKMLRGHIIGTFNLSKLIINKENIARKSNVEWFDYTRSAYHNNLSEPMQEHDQSSKKHIDDTIVIREDITIPEYLNLLEEELEFFIEYLNMIVIKKKIEASDKFANIMSKIK